MKLVIEITDPHAVEDALSYLSRNRTPDVSVGGIGYPDATVTVTD